MDRDCTIGQLAKVGGCTVQTIRYYEQIGLLPEPPRSGGNQRLYSKRHLDRLVFVRHCRELGFSLDQIRKLLRLTEGGERPCGEVDAIAREHLQEVATKIHQLTGLQTELQRIIAICGEGRTEKCRIIETLADHSQCLIRDHGLDDG